MGAPELLELQRTDDAITSLQADIAAVEARLHHSSELDTARAALVAAEADSREADAVAADAEGAGRSLRERARGLDRQLYGGKVRNPQELLTLQHELEELKPRQAIADDDELSAMEAAEQASAALAAARAALAAVEEARRAAAGPDAALLEKLRTQLTDAIANRALVASRRTASELSLYARVAAKRHPAVVRLVGDSCGGCRMPMAINEVHLVRSRDTIVQCSSCDRIVAP